MRGTLNKLGVFWAGRGTIPVNGVANAQSSPSLSLMFGWVAGGLILGKPGFVTASMTCAGDTDMHALEGAQCAHVANNFLSPPRRFSARLQADELYKICSVMGTPTQQTWPEGLKLAAAMNFRFPTFTTTPLSKIVTNASPEAIDLITALCSWDPNKRPTAVQVRHCPMHVRRRLSYMCQRS